MATKKKLVKKVARKEKKKDPDTKTADVTRKKTKLDLKEKDIETKTDKVARKEKKKSI